MAIEKLTGKHWGLIVVGGGMTGIAAAAAAKRHGVQEVLIVEKAGYLGGAAATCLINPFMPYATRVNGERFELSRGLFSEIRSMFIETGAMENNSNNGTLHEEFIKVAFDRFVRNEGIEVLFHAYLCGVQKNDETIEKLSFATKCGVIELNAEYYIDCTGDADLAAMAGCPYHLGREDGLCQPMTLCFRIGNIETETYRKNMKKTQEIYKRMQEEGKIKNPRENILSFDTLIDNVIHFNTTRVIFRNPTDPLDVTEAEMEAREQMIEMYNFLRQYAPGCENCRLLYSASEIGVRESRMIDGEYLLTESDLRDCKQFDDAIAAGNYDIDIHNPSGSGTSHYYFPDGIWYTIPFRSLLPKKADNLVVAGRCISSTHEAQASYRIMPIVTTLGEAAGVGVAVAASDGVKVGKADIRKIQKLLIEAGAFIGRNTDPLS